MSGADTLTNFSIDLPDQDAAIALAGEAESTLHRLEALTGASLVLRGLSLQLRGRPNQLERAAGLVELLRPLWQEGQAITQVDVQTALTALDTGRGEEHQQLGKQVLARSQSGKLLRPRTLKQKAYVEAIERHDLTFALGPAGTGKTFLAAVQAVRALQERRVERLILTRPAVEAGERLGFLPGDLQQKVDPYLRLESGQAFDTFFAPISAGLNQGKTLLETQYPFLGDLRGRALFDTWLENTEILGQAYALADPKLRVKWAGPDMSALSSITARQMETWAHGHEIFDALGEQRKEGDRIKNICHLGVSTFGWTFVNRKMEIPEPVPFVELTAPSGQIWTWNDPASHTSVRGSAVEFAQVVTQVRCFEDTNLEAIGPSAQLWMSLAQCFAGNPESPPAKGSRYQV